jgi:ADP-ribosyl-[dinitrogen reductase] hydrolase
MDSDRTALTTDKAVGCLVGGAVGDALGAPVEFESWRSITRRYGLNGIGDLPMPGPFTDDTQMTLFTAEGIIRASVRGRTRGVWDPSLIIYHAYLRWLYTQGAAWPPLSEAYSAILGGPITPEPDGWLVHDRRLHHRMAPGNTCLSALQSGSMGKLERRINDSKGCGAVMRVAPVGLAMWRQSAQDVYELGCQTAAITHGHGDGIAPAGALAVMIAELVRGANVPQAVASALGHTGGSTKSLLERAVNLSSEPFDPSKLNDELGEGWVGDEALAIAVACAISSDNFEAAVLRAVNHSGDSDSTGSICGNLMGTALGASAVPSRWKTKLGARDLLDTVAADLVLEATTPPDEPDSAGEGAPLWWWRRYPGW